jgi:hypothetical protein
MISLNSSFATASMALGKIVKNLIYRCEEDGFRIWIDVERCQSSIVSGPLYDEYIQAVRQTDIESAMPPAMPDRSGFCLLRNGQMTTINGHC